MSIEELCDKYNITNYTINQDGSIDVNQNVSLTYDELTEIPFVLVNNDKTEFQ